MKTVTLILLCALANGDPVNCNPQNAHRVLRYESPDGNCRMPGDQWWRTREVMLKGGILTKIICVKEQAT